MVFPLDEGLAGRLLQAMLAAPRVKMQRKRFAMGYVSTSFAQCDYLNSSNQYRELTPVSRAVLDEFLATAGPMVETAIGHPFRIGSTRQFQLVPNRPQADRHLDGWPVAMRKIFVLPEGCGKRSSTTWFRRRDGAGVHAGKRQADLGVVREQRRAACADLGRGAASDHRVRHRAGAADQLRGRRCRAGRLVSAFSDRARAACGDAPGLAVLPRRDADGAPVESWLKRLGRSLGRLRPKAG